jgi:hypothetical protein
MEFFARNSRTGPVSPPVTLGKIFHFMQNMTYLQPSFP